MLASVALRLVALRLVAVAWASLSAFLAGGFSVYATNFDSALMQGLTPAAMQGRVSSIASLGKGLQSLAAALASEAIGLLSQTPFKGMAFSLVQGGLAVILIVLAWTLWRPLSQLTEAPE